MRSITIRRLVAAALAIIMAMSFSVSAMAASPGSRCGPGCPVCGGTGIPRDLPAVASFSDVDPSSGFYDAILACAELGIIGGYKDGTFQPSKPVSKSNFTVMLARGFFADDVVKYSTAYLKALNASMPNYMAMFKNGILEGTSFSEERCLYDSSIMTSEINRYDMARLMTNIMDQQGFAASKSEKQAAIGKITDYSSIPSQYRDAVANVYALGVIGGYKDGSFNGHITMNRGQAAAVINRMMQYVEAPEVTEPETPVPSEPEVPKTPEETEETWTGTGKPETAKPGTETGSERKNVCSCCGAENCPCGCTGTKTEAPAPVQPETPVDPKPEQPEVVDPTPVQPVDPTPSQPAEATLANGKAITEENVTAMIQELLKQYPEGTPWASGTHRTGWASITMSYISDSYTRANGGGHTNMQSGCGGLASLFSDSIFGSNDKLPARKVPVNTARPGDLLIELTAEGKLTHVAFVATNITGLDVYATNSVPVLTVIDGGGSNGVIERREHYAVPSQPTTGYENFYVECWTRYPTDGTPVIVEPDTSTGDITDTGNTDSGNTGSGDTGISVPDAPVCSVCGKTILDSAGVWKDNFTRFVCTDCNRK